MKIKVFLISLIISLITIPNVFAQNHIYRIDMDIYINENGSANITEVWDVKGEDGTEWYKVMRGLNDDTLTNFSVSMDGNQLTSKTWNVNESLEAKKGYYGINYTGEGMELCFGKYDLYNRHKFTLNYTLRDFVINTEDSQIVYWNLIDKLSDVDFEFFTVTVRSFYDFPDTLDVWGYGHQGYTYVKDGVIKMTNEDYPGMNEEYVVLLAKFPLNTFRTDAFYEKYNSFEDAYEAAEEGTYKYDYGNKTSFFDKIMNIFFSIFEFFLFPFIIIISMVALSNKDKYGYRNNKKIDKKNTNMFRDIPCNKDIYYANTLIYLNNFGYKESNIIGAIILKWVKENKIKFINETKGVFNKETSKIDLTLNPAFGNELERKLFDIMYKASKDGYLEGKELEKYCRKHYSSFFSLFKDNIDSEITKLKSNNQIYKRISKDECKCKNVMNDTLYEDSKKLYGLKLYLEEFASMDTKEVMEVKLWDEYLMFAYLFGIANKVAKQLKNLYPEVLENSDFNYDTIVFVNHISTSSYNAASSARSAAESYSSGGGGFSIGGGGGGSFGGGGGGSR